MAVADHRVKMEKSIVDLFIQVLSHKNGKHLSVISLSGHLSGLSQKERKYIKQIGGLEKFINKHPEAFLIDGSEVYAIENEPTKKPDSTKSNSDDGKLLGYDKKSTINLESAKDDPCAVCSDPIEIYAIGECRHPICFRCSTKLRVLCGDKNCPVCRRTLDMVVFSKKLLPIDEHDMSVYIRDNEYGIAFETLTIQQQKKALLRHVCPKCPNTSFKTFDGLESHAETKHKLYYCYICVQQCKIFTEERKIFTKQELDKHIEKGDSAAVAGGGHPLCEFCNHRYLDNDELLRHLRMHHCSCRICDKDNEEDKNYQFYADKNSLLDHQREHHIPCEHHDCMDLDQIPVFKNQIDFQSHILQYHSDQKSKMEKRLDQRINVPFKFDRKHVKAKRILKTEPDAAGGINITGSIAWRIEKSYSFIERDDTPNQFEENVFFDLEACGLEPNCDLRTEFATGDRVTAYALPCTNPNAKSRWKAQKVERMDEENSIPFESFPDFAAAGDMIESSPPVSNDFPSLATGQHKVLKPALSGWSSKAATTPMSKPASVHKQTVIGKPDYEIGYIHRNLSDTFGFIQRNKYTDSFEKNIYFHIAAYQPQSGISTIPNLMSELSPGDKVCFVLQNASIPFAKTKLRAQKVWKYTNAPSASSPNHEGTSNVRTGKSTSESNSTNTNGELAKHSSTENFVVIEDILSSNTSSEKDYRTNGDSSILQAIASHSTSVTGNWHQANESYSSIFGLPPSVGDYAPRSKIFAQEVEIPTCTVIEKGLIGSVASTHESNSPFLSQLELAMSNNSLTNGTRSSVVSSIPDYSSDDDESSSDEENSDSEDFLKDSTEGKRFFEVIEVCLQSKPLCKILRQQLFSEMKEAGVHHIGNLQYVELRREDNSAYTLFHVDNRKGGSPEPRGYCKLNGFYPVDSSWSGELKTKKLASKLTKELYVFEGTQHYMTVSKGKGEKTRLMLHYRP